MTFSGDFNPKKVICIVRKMLSELNLQLNDKKICVIKNYSKQVVTGIVVNQKIQVDSKYRKSIRQELYYIKKFGIESHLKKKKVYMDSKQYMNKLHGKVLFVLQINPKDKEFQRYKNYLQEKIKNFKDVL